MEENREFPYRLHDLIDVPLLQALQDRLNAIYSFTSAMLDIDGTILTAAGWQDICTQFHRIRPESELECRLSDQYIKDHIAEANPAVCYRCRNGLVDNATPIIINGKHLGNFFIGQVLLEEPDLEFFKEQARKFNFDEKAYLEALGKVPIWEQEKLDQYLDFMKAFVEMLASIGYKKLEEMETRKRVEESENKYRYLAENIKDVIWMIDVQAEHFHYVSPSVQRLVGYTAEELMALPLDTTLDTETGIQFQNKMQQRLERYQSGEEQKSRYYTDQVEHNRRDASSSTAWM